MLCTLSIRVAAEGRFMLRVSGKTPLGPSGTGGRDGKHYSTAEAVDRDLDVLGLSADVKAEAARVMSNPESRRRFLDFAENVQIPFESLERADIYLFD